MITIKDYNLTELIQNAKHGYLPSQEIIVSLLEYLVKLEDDFEDLTTNYDALQGILEGEREENSILK